jgi:hypothetical protein
MLLCKEKMPVNFEPYTEIENAKPAEIPDPGSQIINTYYYKNFKEVEPDLYKCPDNCRNTFCPT